LPLLAFFSPRYEKLKVAIYKFFLYFIFINIFSFLLGFTLDIYYFFIVNKFIAYLLDAQIRFNKYQKSILNRNSYRYA